VIERLAPKHWRGHLKLVAVLAFGAIVSFYGALASERIASFHFDNWERTRATLAGVLRVVPRVAPGSIVVLLDVPRKDFATGNPADPFGDNMWFDVAMKLAYPDGNVTGYYFWPTAEVPPGNRFYSEVQGRDIDRLIVLRKMGGRYQTREYTSRRVAGRGRSGSFVRAQPARAVRFACRRGS
jgi:hypothetical protein